jgi:hypothetical protein
MEWEIASLTRMIFEAVAATELDRNQVFGESPVA